MLQKYIIFYTRGAYRPAGSVVLQIHEAPGVALDLPGVEEAPGEPDAVADVDGASSPLPAGGEGRLPPRFAATAGNVPTAAGGGYRVRNTCAGHSVGERSLTAT